MSYITKKTRGVLPINWADDLSGSILVIKPAFFFNKEILSAKDQLVVLDFIGHKNIWVKPLAAKLDYYKSKGYPRQAFLGIIHESLLKELFPKIKIKNHAKA